MNQIVPISIQISLYQTLLSILQLQRKQFVKTKKPMKSYWNIHRMRLINGSAIQLQVQRAEPCSPEKTRIHSRLRQIRAERFITIAKSRLTSVWTARIVCLTNQTYIK